MPRFRRKPEKLNYAVGRNSQHGFENHSRLLSLGLLLALAPFSASAREVWIYVTDSGGDRVEVIDPTTNKVVQVIGGIAAPHGVGFSPDGSQIYISNKSKNVPWISWIAPAVRSLTRSRSAGVPAISR